MGAGISVEDLRVKRGSAIAGIVSKTRYLIIPILAVWGVCTTLPDSPRRVSKTRYYSSRRK